MKSELVGDFPVFGSKAHYRSLRDAEGLFISNDSYPAFALNNLLRYQKGFIELNVEQVNGAFNFVTESIKYLYDQGIPEFTLNKEYAKGVAVVFEGNIYLSLIDFNTQPISDTGAWVKVMLSTDIPVVKQIDVNPIGTILTVPVNASMDGYIDYTEGSTFNASLYPDLYATLGTNTFGVINSNVAYESLPVGSLVHLLSADTLVENTDWIEWSTISGLLGKYPELAQVLNTMVQRMPVSASKDAWLNALKTNSLPAFEYSGFHLGFNSNNVGTYTTDTLRKTDVVSLPMVVDDSDIITQVGVAKCIADNTSQPIISNGMIQDKGDTSQYCVVGANTTKYTNTADVRLNTMTIGDADATVPKSIFTRLLIKAASSKTANVSTTHKQIIKAYSEVKV